MNNALLQFKVKERLNKLDSRDWANLSCLQISEAFNKAQVDWVRRRIAEGQFNKQAVEDLQILIEPLELKGTNYSNRFETVKLPDDYMSILFVEAISTKKDCKDQIIKGTLLENGNVLEHLQNWATQPSFEWRETFYTISGNRIQVYTGGDFIVTEITGSYYRFPIEMRIGGCEDVLGNGLLDQQCEFKDDVTEQLINGTCAILAGDMENFNQVQRNLQT